MESDPAATPHSEEPAPAASGRFADLMNSLKSLPQLQAKDWLVVVPLLATCIAITYELGSFLPLGAESFALFSLSDHLLWAIEVLPAACASAAAFLIGGAFVLVLDRKPTTEAKVEAEPAQGAGRLISGSTKFAALFFVIGVAGVFVAHRYPPDSADAVLRLFLPFYVMVWLLFPVWVRDRMLLTGVFVVCFVLAYVFAWG